MTLSPLDITVNESWNNDFTSVNLAISECIGGTKRCREVKSEQAQGFVDGMFKACFDQYAETTPSLHNIRLTDYRVKPNFNKARSIIGSDAKTEVTIIVDIDKLGKSEFSCTSRSVLHSSFSAILQAFEFYINCEKTFDKLQFALKDAQNRNRGDIAQICTNDLCTLTGVNTYEKGKKS